MTVELHDFGGGGPDVLLLHGGGDNIETWRELAPRLGRSFHVWAYDPPAMAGAWHRTWLLWKSLFGMYSMRPRIRAVFRRNHVPNGDGRLRRVPDLEYAIELARVYQGAESGLTREKIEAARCPVRMLCSEAWVTSQDARRTLSDLRGPRVEWLDTSHYLHWDAPEDVAGRIEAFP